MPAFRLYNSIMPGLRQKSPGIFFIPLHEECLHSLREDLSGGAGELRNVMDAHLILSIHAFQVLEVFGAAEEKSIHEDSLAPQLLNGIGRIVDRDTSFIGTSKRCLLAGGKAGGIIGARVRQDNENVLSCA